MDNITYDVRVYKTEVYKGKTVTTYYVRWKAGRTPVARAVPALRPSRKLPQQARKRRQGRRGIQHRHRPPGRMGTRQAQGIRTVD